MVVGEEVHLDDEGHQLEEFIVCAFSHHAWDGLMQVVGEEEWHLCLIGRGLPWYH